MKKKIVATVATVMLTCTCLFSTGCAAIDSWGKDVEADVAYLNRHVAVYDCTGANKIWEYTGDVRITALEGDMVSITTRGGKRINVAGGILVSEEL